MDVAAFIGILLATVWIVLPLTSGDPVWKTAFIVSALAVPVVSLALRRRTLKTVGLRLDNIIPALVVYLTGAVAWASVFLLWHRDALGSRSSSWPDVSSIAGALLWAILQEFCLLSFLLTRLKEILDRPAAAVLAAAVIFGTLHLPNPFLTVYTLGGGLILGALWLRWPNLLAAAVAHATASALVGRLLPKAVTGAMKVGPGYW